MKTLALLTEFLGYTDDAGFVESKDFAGLPNHKHALRIANSAMSVKAAFGLWMGGNGSLSKSRHSRFTPLVFMAHAPDLARAKQIHRSAWSQGLAPYLLIFSKEKVWFCQGFDYSAKDWEEKAITISIAEFTNSQSKKKLTALLKPIMAPSLKSSIAWRDEARIADEFVDERLLQSLAELSATFSDSTVATSSISPPVVNALIARLLYFYFLVDREFITEERLHSWGLEGITLNDENEWSLKDSSALFSRLDEVFNGSIFPIPQEFVGSFDASHINQLRRVIREGESASGQISFFDYDFSTIRTETLSAIYEMFLRNEVENAGKQYGAFYTPPYVADYTLDRLEDQRPLIRGTRVLDPAAGSGVFLVGAYRRIVEACLPKGTTRLPLKDLHDLMMTSIFAVELNETACHVAAFSLYLTMLDYVDPTEANEHTNWPIVEGESRLFPPMLGSHSSSCANIQAADFFSEEISELVVDVVVGNPPWVSLTELKSNLANNYLKSTKAPIGDKQAAELFVWKAYKEHLSDDGLIGLLIPQKSLVNARSEKFSKFLRDETQIVGIADMAHLRYRLFHRSSAKTAGSVNKAQSNSARQSTAAIFLKKGTPDEINLFWTFRPLLSLQPSSRRNRLWIVIHDWTQVSWHEQSETNEKAWRRLFTCSQVDRHILKKLDEYVAVGRFKSIGQLQATIGLTFTIKDNEKLDQSFVLTANPKKPTYWKRQLGLIESLFEDENSCVPLPKTQLELSPIGASAFLKGNVVLMPRTCETALYVEKPVATKSFVIGSFTEISGNSVTKDHKIFLKAMAAYMSTNIFRYLCFVNGRRMTIDRVSIELGAVKQLPWPFGGIGDEKLIQLINANSEERENLVADSLRLTNVYKGVIQEFTSLRKRFSDGATPIEALRPVSEESIKEYEGAMMSQVDRGKGRYTINHEHTESGLMATIVQYTHNRNGKKNERPMASHLESAFSEYKKHGASGMTQSRYLWHSKSAMTTILIKPEESLHWTLDRAFSDADLIIAAAMSGISNTVAA